MNSRSVQRLLRDRFNLHNLRVEGERSGDLRFFTICLPPGEYDQAGRIKDAVVELIRSRGYAGGCDVVASTFPYAKLA